ncbi:MAG TPA: GvpL/GvpF family gas vesicle protein, partial [Blastocatellia bacterium]
MNLYAYCLSDEVTPGVIDLAQGVAGAQARLIECGSLKAVVSDFDGERAQVTRESIFAHESIIHRVLARTTPLPFRFGMVTTEARLESYVGAHERALLVQLSRVRGAVEMSVKIIWDAEAVKRAAIGQADGEAVTSAPEMTGPGAAFLAAKR